MLDLGDFFFFNLIWDLFKVLSISKQDQFFYIYLMPIYLCKQDLNCMEILLRNWMLMSKTQVKGTCAHLNLSPLISSVLFLKKVL